MSIGNEHCVCASECQVALSFVLLRLGFLAGTWDCLQHVPAGRSAMSRKATRFSYHRPHVLYNSLYQ